MPKEPKKSRNQKDTTTRAQMLSAVRETCSELIFNAVYIACIEREGKFSNLNWQDILPFIVSAENHADPIMYNGQWIDIDNFVSQNLRIISRHFYNNFCDGRGYLPATAQFLQKFIRRVQLQMLLKDKKSITVSNKEVFDDKQESGLQTLDVLQAFSRSKFNTFLDERGQTLISEYKEKQRANNAQAALVRYHRDQKSKATSTFPDATEVEMWEFDETEQVRKAQIFEPCSAEELTENLFRCV